MRTSTQGRPGPLHRTRSIASQRQWASGWSSALGAVICGDQCEHREVDIKNWKGNTARGFLGVRAGLSRRVVRPAGWVDLGRRFGVRPWTHTWWSWRGKAFDNDAGWSDRLRARGVREWRTGVAVSQLGAPPPMPSGGATTRPSCRSS